MNFNARYFFSGLLAGFLLGVILFVSSSAIEGKGPPDPGVRPSPNPGPSIVLPLEYQP